MTQNAELLRFPQALVPTLRIPRANRPIPLYSGPITFVQPGEKHRAQGTVSFVWLPSPRISFMSRLMPLNMKYAYSSSMGPVELYLNDGRIIDQAHITKMLPGVMTA